MKEWMTKCMDLRKELDVAVEVGIGYVDHTGCHQLLFLTIRPTRVALTPGCHSIG
jgi:hypothetical protein